LLAQGSFKFLGLKCLKTLFSVANMSFGSQGNSLLTYADCELGWLVVCAFG